MNEDLDKKIREVEQSRKTSFKIQRGLLLALLISLFAVLISVVALFAAWSETERERRIAEASTEQKQEIAQEAQQALCGTEEREIYDRELCAKWTELAESNEQPVEIVDVSQAEIVDAFRAYCEAGNCRGADGQTPTADDVAAAFARFCADGNCQGEPGVGTDGTDGQDGRDGSNATPEMVLAAVTDYCSDGRCVGAAGADGAPGPPPSTEAIAEAVNAFCANGACVGPAGANGTNGTNGVDGAPGAPGRGVTSVQCQQEPEYAWIITYTDGTSEAVPGPCRAADPVVPIPDED